MNPAPTRCALALPILLAAACSSTRTSFDWDQHFDFTGARTWAWVGDEPGRAPDDLTRQRIQRSIEVVLAERGYRQVDAAPDFQLAWTVKTQDKMRATEWGGYADPYNRHWTGSYGSRTVDITYYEEGSLIVDVIDPAEARLVWRGTATRALDRSTTPEQADAIVREAVELIFDGFPPGK